MCFECKCIEFCYCDFDYNDFQLPLATNYHVDYERLDDDRNDDGFE